MGIANQFGWIGWCKEDNHDKVWGYFFRPTPGIDEYLPLIQSHSGRNCCIFWARRGRAMQFKSDVTGYELGRLVDSKLKKGYDPIDQPRLFEIWPSFVQEAEAKLMWDVLSGKIK